MARLAFIAACSLLLGSASAEHASRRMEESFTQAGLRPAVLDAAMGAYREHEHLIQNHEAVGIIDYSLPSRRPRFFVFNARSGRTEVLLVAHGEGSRADSDGVPTRFSNLLGSHMTSLGPYLTAETYFGRHGLSLRLDGLAESNDLARRRYIVIHGAEYVDAEAGYVGESWGCPAVDLRVAEALIERFKDGAFLYIHGERARTIPVPAAKSLQAALGPQPKRRRLQPKPDNDT